MGIRVVAGANDYDAVEEGGVALEAAENLISDLDEPPRRRAASLRYEEPLEARRGACFVRKPGISGGIVSCGVPLNGISVGGEECTSRVYRHLRFLD